MNLKTEAQLRQELENVWKMLTAEREARGKAEADRNGAMEQYFEAQKAWRTALQRAESAEQRNREAQEQKPCAYMCAGEAYTNWQEAYDMHCELHYDIFNLYAQPPIPPNVAELQRQLEEAKRQAVPEGWKLVPVQMTDKMRDAGNEIVLDRSKLVRIWDSMLSAAPLPEGVDR